MTQSDIINNNFSKAFECIKCSNAYDTGEVLSEEKLFKQISERKHSTFDLSKFTVVGSPTITDDGVASGFSGGNYLKTPDINLNSASNWNIIIPIKLSSVAAVDNTTILDKVPTSSMMRLMFRPNNHFTIYLQSDTGTNIINGDVLQSINEFALGTSLLLKISFTGTQYIISSSTNNGESWTQEISVNSTLKVADGLFKLGIRDVDDLPFMGSIDLKQFSITIDGKEVFNGNKTGIDVINDIEIPYTLSKTGSKIVDVAYRDRVIDLYEQQGHARYYTIDEENKNFTLPMGEIYGMIENIKNTKRGGSGLEVGDISTALYVNEAKNLRRYLNGQIVDNNNNTKVFIEDYLLGLYATNPEYFATEENWQAEALLNIDGCVYKFVLNYSGETVVSVRLPKYPDYVEINAGGTLPVVGNGISIGLTNGAANYGMAVQGRGIPNSVYSYGLQPVANGFGSNVGTDVGLRNDVTSNQVIGVTTNPTKSGIQTTLKQTKLKLRYFIQIATGSETENNIINDIDLNNPYSLFDSKYSDHELNNLSWLKSEGQWNAKAVYTDAYDKLLKVYNGTETVAGLSVKLSTETYTDYDFVLNTADETFRLPLKTLHTDNTVDSLSLYFYVGETVQNANLIDAGRIGEQLAGKVNLNAPQIQAPYIKETYKNGTSWYRVWSDGWCEQGGNYNGGTKSGTITLLKEYKDVNSFQVMTQCYFASSGYGYQIGIYNQSVNKFSWTASGSNYKFYWKASGYII